VLTRDSRLNKGWAIEQECQSRRTRERGAAALVVIHLQLTAHTPLTVVVVVAYPFATALAPRFSTFPYFPTLPTVRHNLHLPDSPGHVAVRSTRREAQSEEPKQSKPKGTRSVTCWYPPLPFALYSILHTLRPKPILAHIPHRLLCLHPFHPLHTAPTPPRPRTKIQLQSSRSNI
jgi:hypothetical protein